MKTAQSGLQANTALINRRTFAAGLLGLAVVSATGSVQAQDAKEHPLKPAMRMVEECREKVTELSGYE
ncbi:MAG: hypothetical protein KDA85_03340, partial [Planctomycetaceae bacterium]|nr:hypothetical protein [Planctomycetaceae bacterium]